MTDKRWTIGITHLIKPPFDPEESVFADAADIIFFDTSDESKFDPSLLNKLDALLVWTPSISTATIQHLQRCKILVRYGVGYDKIDRNALAQHGIAFSNNPEYGPEDVADTAMAMLLTLQRRIVEHDAKARSYTDSWQENHLTPLLHSRNCSVGIVGLGRIGSSLSLRLKPFGYRIFGYDPYLSNGMFRALGVERVTSLEELLARVDMLSMHCPLTDETRGMISANRLAQAKPGLIFVNTARGGLIENLEVIESALASGQLAAAGLDVLPEEPPGDHSLISAWRENSEWLRGRLLITPHNAFYSDSSMLECRSNAAQTARLLLEENIHRNAVD
jgi:phosphoglycerate dehydrogenase-like enzyme